MVKLVLLFRIETFLNVAFDPSGGNGSSNSVTIQKRSYLFAENLVRQPPGEVADNGFGMITLRSVRVCDCRAFI